MNENELCNNENYIKWREIHTKAFGDIFSLAFSENESAQEHLTAALIHISKRNFTEALTLLQITEPLCINSFDKASVYYFKGLCHELLENEKEMSQYYRLFAETGIEACFPLPFHPYYRTAKNAQRDSECKKAIFYYRKALELYDGRTPSPKISATVSQIAFDVATVYLYDRDYSASEKFLKISRAYSPAQNLQRSYLAAVLCAVRGNAAECERLISTLNDTFKPSCEAITKSIFEGSDLHHCTVLQDRSGYPSFWRLLSQCKKRVESLLQSGDTENAQEIVSLLLSEAMPFAKRRLECRIARTQDRITVFCKTYRIKTLSAEYEALLKTKPKELADWSFEVVDYFESY